MATLKNSINVNYGSNKLVKTFSRYYDESRTFLTEVDSSDTSNTLMTFDNTGAAANSLKDCKTMVLCNEGKTALEISLNVSVITHAEPDTAGTNAHYIKYFLAPGEALSFPNGKVALYAADESICLGVTTTLSPTLTADIKVDTTANVDVATSADIASDTAETVLYLEATGLNLLFEVGDIIQIEDEILEVTSIGTGADLANTRLIVERGKFGSTAATHADGVAVYWPFFNTYYNWNKVLRGSTQLATSDQRGRWKAKNLCGGRSVTDITGIVPGSFAARFFTKAYQEIGFANPANIGDSTDLAASTAYRLGIIIADSAATDLLFSTTADVTFKGPNGVIAVINNALDAAFKDSGHGLYGYKATCGLVGGQLRFTDGTNMHAHDGTNGSKILLSAPSGGTTIFGVGIFPAIGAVQTPVIPAHPSPTTTDALTGLTRTNDGAYMIDDSKGNLIYPANTNVKVGTINYITGAHSWNIARLPYAGFEITYNSNSGFSGSTRSNTSTSGNHIHSVKARSINTKVNGHLGSYIFK